TEIYPLPKHAALPISGRYHAGYVKEGGMAAKNRCFVAVEWIRPPSGLHSGKEGIWSNVIKNMLTKSRFAGLP
ncbi:hypothetical protein, partial [Salmonella enterica]|uniref:hypothetical protein n=1 Tax=Salmonella enterica TaxID=28901 RepID=UPI000A83D512